MAGVIPRYRHDDVESAAAALAAGAVLAVPTDTVYGVAASLEHPASIARLFTLKGRPPGVALPVLIASEDQLEQLEVVFTERARRLSAALWPGALTIVVPAAPRLAALVGAPGPSVGLRWPNDPDLLALIALSGPLAVTSANAHGEPPCHTADEVERAFGEDSDLDGIVDGGRRDGTVSSVVDLTGEDWVLRRAGAVSPDQLTAILGVGPAESGPQ